MMKYQAHAFHDEFEKGKSSGVLETESSVLSFTVDGEKKVSIPYKGLVLERGGASDRLIYFKHSDFQDWVLYSSDQSVLEDDYLQQFCYENIQALKRQKLKGRGIVLTTFVIFILALVGLWALKKPITHKLAEAVPVEVEVELGQQVFDLYSKQTKIMKDEKLQKDLEAFFAELTDHIKDKPYPYKFHIVVDASPNAAAFPGGNIIVHTGLFDLAETPEEILGVLAHEIAHVNERHSLHSMLNAAGTVILAQVFLGDVEALSGFVLEGGVHLLMMKNSREHETEADFEGLAYLQEAKINPKGLVSFFEKLDAWKPEAMEGTEEALSFMSTHPLSKERVAYLEEKVNSGALAEYRKINFDFEQFKTAIKESLQNNNQVKEKVEEQQEKE